MGIYSEYTYRKVVTHPIIFRCEHCKKITVFNNSFHISSTYNDRVTLFGPSVSERKEQAQIELQKEENSLFSEISADIIYRSFKDSALYCVCGHCRAVPKWSRFRKKWLEILCYLLPVITFFAVGQLSNFIDGITDIHIWSAVGITLPAIAIPRILYAHKNKQIKAMDEAYMPILCKDAQHLLQVLKELDSTEDIATNMATSPNNNHS